MIIQDRDVRKKEISRSFRGILRVSPDQDNTDVGVGPDASIVTDSLGNTTPIKLGTETFESSNTILTDKLTFNTSTNVPTEQPTFEDTFLADNNGNYTLYNLRQFLDEYFQTNTILEQLVPVGTILYIAINDHDLNRLPSKYHGWYDFCHGQNNNTQNNLAYNSTNYPDLSKMLQGATIGPFNLPDLRNKFIRSASNIDEEIVTADEGTFIIDAHQPLQTELPHSNPGSIFNGLRNVIGTFLASRYQLSQAEVDANTTGCFTSTNYKNIEGHRKYSGESGISKYYFDGAKSNSATPSEPAPYNISLVPIIKIK